MTGTCSEVEFGVWDASDRGDHVQWLAFWRQWPEREVQAHPDYVRLFADRPGTRALAAYWKSASGYVLYPFLMRDLSLEPFWQASIGKCADITSPYGYGGPFCWQCDKEEVAAQFWNRFDHWASERRVVSEFVRMSLLDDALLPYPGSRVPRLTNVTCDLSNPDELPWNTMKPKVRRNVKKAEREGIVVVRDDSGDSAPEFRRLYTATMDRRAASSGYYFPDSFYEQLHVGLRGHFAYFHALYRGRAISTELVLISQENVYFFLGGTDGDYFPMRPNELLKFKIMLWAQSIGMKRYVLGGGVSEGDSLFQYKESFAPSGKTTFCVGQRVLESTLYEQLVAMRSTSQAKPWTEFFPAYRAA